MSILAEPLEHLVGQAVVALLDGGALQAAARRLAHTGSDAAASAELERIEDERRLLGEQWGDASPAFIRAALGKLERRERKARAALSAEVVAEVAANVPLALIADGVDAESWEDIGVDRQRQVLSVLADLGLTIAVAPTVHGGGPGGARPGIDVDRVSICRPPAVARAESD